MAIKRMPIDLFVKELVAALNRSSLLPSSAVTSLTT